MSVYSVENLPDTADCFVFDTNILLFLHGFYRGNRNKNFVDTMRDYSKIANNIVANDSVVYIDYIALSEFVNKYINHAMADKLGMDYKDFKFDKRAHRPTEEYAEAIADLQQVINQIMSSYNIQIVSDGYDDFNTNMLKDVLPVMELNDHLISLVAKKHNAVLVTHDRDIVESCPEIDIVTALTR